MTGDDGGAQASGSQPLAGLLRAHWSSRQPQVSLRSTARRLGIAHTTLGRWLDGTLVPSVEQVVALADALKITGRPREDLLQVARWASVRRGTTGLFGVSDQVAETLEIESRATGVAEWSPLRIPDLLQTPHYARTTEKGDVHSSTLKLGRQSALLEGDGKKYEVYLGMPALTSRVGGAPVMAEQVERLITVTDRGPTRLRLVPPDLDWHDGQLGPFVLYEQEDGPGVVHIQHIGGVSTYLTQHEVVARYRSLLAELDDLALSREQTRGHLEDVLQALGGPDRPPSVRR
ncbi:helix-turn-helix transcriptional regulator [Amycolatopsis thermoflava]|uniref:helix-turn-helix domain-containing protein n=1 Tax=Amycolatopsis thermoflava TaxID=84480 RepID=UPI00364E8839